MFGILRRGSGSATQTPQLVLLARSGDPDQRRQVAEELGTSAEPWAAGELVRLLQDAHAPVREAAQAGLRRQGPTAVPALLRGLDHSDSKVAASVADLLGELRPAAGVERLLMALKFGTRPVQLAATRALARYGSAARAAVEAERAGAEPWVRRQIDEILAAPADAAPVEPQAPVAEVPLNTDSATGWSGTTSPPDPGLEADRLQGPRPPLGRWMDTWGLAILLVIVVMGVVALVASFR
jgi:HEAT repeats